MEKQNECLKCGKITQNVKFCSLSCSSSFNMTVSLAKKREKRIKEYDKHPKKCKCCKQDIPYKKKDNKFCSHSCAATVSNKGIRRHGKSPNNCLNCGKKTSSYMTICCSHKCAHEHKYKEYIKRWLNEDENGIKGGGVSNHIRRYLFEKYDNKCQKCSWGVVNKYTNNVPLTVHYKDGNWKNNEVGNLELICPNYHSLTKTYMAGNKGNGRAYRKQRYKDGKSF